ncbi:hypothetical protein JG688_00006712, partial [Phytophthora aleatoria]
LDQVGDLIAQFLGPKANLSLSEAWSRTTHWSLSNYLRSDEFYSRWEFAEAVKVAVSLDNVSILRWFFSRFKGCLVPSDVVVMATEKGSLPILEFLLANDSSEDNKVQWGAASVQQALRHDHLDVVHWLYKNTSQTETTEEQHEWTIKAAMDADDIEFCQSLLPKGVAIRDLAATDQLDLMNRIASEHNPPPEDSGWPKVWGDALAEVCMADRLSTVQWLLKHPTGRQAIAILRGARSLRADKTLSKLLSYPAELCNVEMMQYLYDQGAVDRLGNTLLDAIRANQVESVKWLLQHFPDSERIPDYAVMHEAARPKGHLEVVKWLQPNRSEGCSSNAMDFAASNGHLEIVRWLHLNTSAGCTSDAMDLAAAGGHLNVLKWLRENRNEGCTVGAIEQTLSNGFLDVACWLRLQYPELVPQYVLLRSSANLFGVLLVLKAYYASIFTPEFVQSARDAVSGTFAMLDDVPILEWLKHNYPVPDMPEGQRDRHFAGLADRILGNIAQQIAGQLGGAVHVNVVRGQQGAGQAEPDGVLGMMNNFVVFARGNNDDANNNDESSSEDDDE